MRGCAIGFILAAPLAVLGVCSGSAATLAVDGRATCTVVVAADAIEAEKTAATELASYIERITGARPRVQAEPADGTNVFVGRCKAVDQRLAKLDWDALGSDGIVIRTDGNDLILAGCRPRGTLYAVYTFLQDVLGCRWYAADADEVIPAKPTVEVKDLDVVYRPPFDFRQHYTAALKDLRFAVKLRENGREWGDTIPAEYGGDVGFGGAHTLRRQFLKSETYFADHPDWYAYDKAAAKRTPGAICFTNAEGGSRCAEEVLAYLTEHPETRIISVSCDDSNAVCECDPCSALREREGGESGPLLHFVNAVAERVEREHPGVLVSTLAYWHTDRPPATIRPRPNVLIHMGVLDRNHKKAIPDVPNFSRYLKRWRELTDHVYMWDYDPHFANFLQPHPNHFVVGDSMRFYRAQGVSGVLVQGGWGEAEFMRMRAWVTAQLMWNPEQDERALISDFLNGYYGGAGPHLLGYLDLINAAVNRQPDLWLGVYDATTRHWLTLDDMNEATRLFDDAEAAVVGDEMMLRRVRLARLSVDIVWLERYRELRRIARQEGLTFRGPEDPYAQVERIARNEFGIDCCREWEDFSGYVAKLRALFPPRVGTVPSECAGLRPGEWEDIQEGLLTALPTGSGDVVADAAASDGRALRLTGDDKALQAQYTLPAHLGGRWRICAAVRAEPAGAEATGIVAGVYAWNMPSGNANEVARVVAECPPGMAGGYRMLDLGVHRLQKGATIQVQPNGSGSYGAVRETWVDRIVLIAAE